MSPDVKETVTVLEGLVGGLLVGVFFLLSFMGGGFGLALAVLALLPLALTLTRSQRASEGAAGRVR